MLKKGGEYFPGCFRRYAGAIVRNNKTGGVCGRGDQDISSATDALLRIDQGIHDPLYQLGDVGGNGYSTVGKATR